VTAQSRRDQINDLSASFEALTLKRQQFIEQQRQFQKFNKYVSAEHLKTTMERAQEILNAIATQKKVQK